MRGHELITRGHEIDNAWPRDTFFFFFPHVTRGAAYYSHDISTKMPGLMVHNDTPCYSNGIVKPIVKADRGSR